jgi:hypothetical protein
MQDRSMGKQPLQVTAIVIEINVVPVHRVTRVDRSCDQERFFLLADQVCDG